MHFLTLFLIYIQSLCATTIETPSLDCTVDVTRVCHVAQFRLLRENRSCSTRIKAIHHEIVVVGRGNVRDSLLEFLFDLERGDGRAFILLSEFPLFRPRRKIAFFTVGIQGL